MMRLFLSYQNLTPKKAITSWRGAEMLNMRSSNNRNSKRWICYLRSYAAAAVLCIPAAAKVVTVQTASEFQTALDVAMPGDEIVLQAGATYTGNFRLRNNGGTTPVLIRTSAVDSLPPTGTRLTPSYAPFLPKLITPNSTAALIVNGAHNYKLTGIEIAPAAGVYSYTLVDVGPFDARSIDQLSSNIDFDRVYIHGDPIVGAKRGITLNGRNVSVRDSWISGIVSNWNETQALLGWNGPGPFTIVNNYLEASGENIMFGGATATIPNVVPCDIEIRSNYLFKQPSWNPSDPSYAGTKWTVKNLFELKNACRVRVLDNVLENNWVESQSGWAILLTPRTEYGKMPWAVVEDIEIRGNVIRNSPAGVTILGQDGNYGGQLRRVTITNNWFDKVGSLRLFGIFNAALDVAVDHNTCVSNTHSVIFAEGRPSLGFIATNNIFQNGTYGIIGSGVAPGLSSVNTFFPDSQINRNAFVNGSSTKYPAFNYFPKSVLEVGFSDPVTGDYALSSESAYRTAAADGSPLGADMAALRVSERAAKIGMKSSTSSEPAVSFSLAATPTTLTGGSGAMATLSLSSKAPIGGLVITLECNTPGIRVPSSVPIFEGVQIASFLVSTNAVRVATDATISARLGNQSRSVTIRVASPALVDLALNRVAIVGGGAPIPDQQIVLSGPAPDGGAVVALSTSNAAVAVPASVTVPSGSRTATFALSAATVPQDVVAQVSASFDGAIISRPITIAPPRLAQVYANPATIEGGVITGPTYSVSLDGPAMSDVQIALSTSNPAIASVPQSVTVPKGSASAVFAISSHPVTVDTPVTLSAAYGASVKSTLVTVTRPAAAPRLATISVYPATLVGGTNTGATSIVYLTAPLDVPVTVSLVSSNPSIVAVPQFVTVPAGSLSAAFPIVSQPVSAATPITITAMYGTAMKSTTVSVIPR